MPAYESRSYDNLIAGMVQPMVTVSVIVKAGSGVIQRGMVLGVVGQLPEGGSSAGMYIVVPVDSSKTDGSEKPFAVLADDVIDATSSDIRATGYVSGEFNRAALTFGGTDKVATHEEELRKIGIITKRVVS